VAISTDSSVVTRLTAEPPAPSTGSIEARHRRVAWRPSRRRLGLLRRPGLGLLMAAATAVLLAWHLGRPAVWLDEAASVAAAQRTWPALCRLLDGPDAPLVPYYAVLKLFTDTATQVYPAAAQHPDVLFRAPSAIAMVLAGWALIAWLARFCPARLVIGTGVVFLLSTGISRYGQEARPYAIVVLAAVIATLSWTVAISHRRRAWVLLYALGVALLTAANPLAGSLVVAHLVAALSLERGDRLQPVLRTLAGAALGIGTALPLALVVSDNGGGATRFPATSFDSLLRAFVGLFTLDRQVVLDIGWLLILCLLGATRVFSHRYRFIARLALAWAAVPPLVLLPAVLMRPNLLIGRYLMFTVPGWAVLGGLGVATVIDVVRRLVRLGLQHGDRWWPGWSLNRVPTSEVSAGQRWRRARARAFIGNAAALSAAVALVVGLVHVQQPSLRIIRTANGHGADPRPALADAREPQFARLPIIPSVRAVALQAGVYDPSAVPRLSGVWLQWSRTDIWPLYAPNGVRREIYRRLPRAIVLIQPDNRTPDCSHVGLLPQQFAYRCMPRFLQQVGFRVTDVRVHGRGLVFVVVERPAPLRGRRVRHPHAVATPGITRDS
jgi:hypothetical protein